jgi:hypothetical protein
VNYDLFFRPTGQTPPCESRRFANFFEGRACYKVEDDRADYVNEDTGVFFNFQFDEGLEDPYGDPASFPVCFSMNYLCPHVFGLEAAPEVAAFVAAFSLEVEDPQVGGMGRGAFQAERFFNGWSRGNEMALQLVLKDPPDRPIYTLPTARLEACWRWNYSRKEELSRVGEDVFVPRLLHVIEEGKVQTVVTWTDGAPTLLPEADIVALVRMDLSLVEGAQEIVVLPFAALEGLLSSYSLGDGPLRFWNLTYEQVPAQVVKFFQSFAAAPRRFEGIALGNILNGELVRKFKNY